VAYLLSDRVQGTIDSLLQAHSPNVGAGWAKNPVSAADLLIATNGARHGGAGHAIYQGGDTPATADQGVSATFKVLTMTASTLGVMVRCSETLEQHYSWRMQPNSSAMLMDRFGGPGTISLANVPFTFVAGRSYRLRLEVTGSTLKGYVDDVLIATATDTALGTGRTGIRSYNGAALADGTGVQISDVLAYGLPAPATDYASDPDPTGGQTSGAGYLLSDRAQGVLNADPAPGFGSWVTATGATSMGKLTGDGWIYPPDGGATATVIAIGRTGTAPAGEDQYIRGTVSLRATPAGGTSSVSVAVRMTDNDNFYDLALSTTGMLLRKKRLASFSTLLPASAFPQVGTNATALTGKVFDVELWVAGNVISGTVNGVPFSYTDTGTALATGGRPAYRMTADAPTYTIPTAGFQIRDLLAANYPLPARVYDDRDQTNGPAKTYRSTGRQLGPAMYFALQEAAGATTITDDVTGTVLPLLGGTNHATFGTSPPTNIEGTAADFTTALGKGYGAAPPAAALVGPKGRWTFEAWVLITSGSTTRNAYAIAEGSSTSAAPIIGIAIDANVAGELVSYLRDGSNNVAHATTSGVAAGPYNDGLWHHVVATYDGTTNSLYVDGVVVALAANLPGSKPPTDRIAVGDLLRTASVNVSWPGKLAHAASYPRAFSAAEVVSRYNHRAGAFGLRRISRSGAFSARPGVMGAGSLAAVAVGGPTTVDTQTRLVYDTRAAISVARGVLYDIRGSLSVLRALLYDVRNAASSARAYPFDIRSAVSGVRALPYDVRALLVASSAVRYDLRALAGASSTLRYDTRALAAATRSLRYDTRALLAASRGLRYDVRMLAAAARSVRYDMRAAPLVSRILPYDVRTGFVVNEAFPYDVRESLMVPHDFVYDIEQMLTNISYRMDGTWVRRKRRVRNNGVFA
jgi:hypothetical protein